MADDELETSQVVRIGDMLANQEEYREADEWIGSVINQLEQGRAYSTREFLHLIGRELAEIANEDGILTSAFKARVPIYCADLAASEVGVGMVRSRFEKKTQFVFDNVQDSLEMMQIAQRTRNSGFINLGSHDAKNFLDLAELSLYIVRTNPRGHKYAISIANDTPPQGARTPSIENTFTSNFGKLVRGATTAYVDCDASIAIPMLVTALSQTAAKYMKGRKRPNFIFQGKDLQVDIP
jgi:deoxyhypusine synthase